MSENSSTLQNEAVLLAKSLGIVVDPLSSGELNVFERSFSLQFIIPYAARDIQDIFIRYKGEALLGAMIAKKQMEAEIDGEQPEPGKVGGPLPIRASYLGIGDGWRDIYGIYSNSQGYWDVGSAQSWIHSGTTLLAGSDDAPVKILDNAVHVIVAIGSLHPSPKIEAVKFERDGKELPVFNTSFIQQQPGSLHIKELDRPLILKKNTTLFGQVFISSAMGDVITRATDYPYLVGFSYIREAQTRILDPADIVGTTEEVVTTT